MYLYNSYCYADILSAADSIQSHVFMGDGSVILSAVGSGSSVTVTTNLSTFTVSLPTCNKLGFDNSYTGISTSDAVAYGSLISFVLVLAWSIKILRRAI